MPPAELKKRLGELHGGARLRAEKALEQTRDLARQNPLAFYQPHPKQITAHEMPQWIRAYFGGNRAGKTTFGICDDLIQVCPNELLPTHLRPYKRFECPVYVRIVCPSVQILNPVVIQKVRDWCPQPLLKNGMFDSSYDKAGRTLRFECGCRFDFMTYEQTLDKFGGAALHRIHYDEEPPQDIRIECANRLLDFNGDELFTMTPTQGMTWMFDGIWGRRDIDDNIGVVVSSMDENPHLSDEAKKRILGLMSDEERQARVEGRFVHMEGMVYPRFRNAMCANVERQTVQDLEVVVGIDPGIRVAGLVYTGWDSDNNVLVFHAEALLDRDVSQIAARIRQINEQWELVKQPHYVIDPQARAREQTHGVRIETEYNLHGIYPEHGQTDREAGIAMIRRRVDHNALLATQSCQRLFWEAERYRQQLRDDGRYDVIKEHDHCLDALRYAVMSRPWGAMGDPGPVVQNWEADFEIAFPPSMTDGPYGSGRKTQTVKQGRPW